MHPDSGTKGNGLELKGHHSERFEETWIPHAQSHSDHNPFILKALSLQCSQLFLTEREMFICSAFTSGGARSLVVVLFSLFGRSAPVPGSAGLPPRVGRGLAARRLPVLLKLVCVFFNSTNRSVFIQSCQCRAQSVGLLVMP